MKPRPLDPSLRIDVFPCPPSRAHLIWPCYYYCRRRAMLFLFTFYLFFYFIFFITFLASTSILDELRRIFFPLPEKKKNKTKQKQNVFIIILNPFRLLRYLRSLPNNLLYVPFPFFLLSFLESRWRVLTGGNISILFSLSFFLSRIRRGAIHPKHNVSENAWFALLSTLFLFLHSFYPPYPAQGSLPYDEEGTNWIIKRVPKKRTS